jgi:hypothetical protein
MGDSSRGHSVVCNGASAGQRGHRPPASSITLFCKSGHITRCPNPKNPHSNPKNPNTQYPKSSSDSECYYPNLFWVIWVAAPCI